MSLNMPSSSDAPSPHDTPRPMRFGRLTVGAPEPKREPCPWCNDTGFVFLNGVQRGCPHQIVLD